MKDRQLYEELLGLCAPWRVTAVKMNWPAQEITVTVACAEGEVWACPACAHRLHVPGWEERTWRHRDTCPCRTRLTARGPRLRCSHPQCPDGRTQIVPVPWAEKSSRFTRSFERLAIAVLLECSFSGAGQILRLSWDEADGIQSRAVRRGLARKAAAPPPMRRLTVCWPADFSHNRKEYRWPISKANESCCCAMPPGFLEPTSTRRECVPT